MENTVIDKDLGWGKAFKALTSGNHSPYTKVGVQQGATRKTTGLKNQTSDMVKIATINELGTKPTKFSPGIPPRPANRLAFEKNLTALNIAKEKLYKKVLSGVLTFEKALKILGEMHVANVKNSIRDLRTPPNAQSTIDKKKSDNPLIDEGQYINSITHVEVI